MRIAETKLAVWNRRLLFVATLFLLLFASPSLNAGEAEALQQQEVYVVMSNNAYAYHINQNCPALKKATHPIKKVTLEKAKEMGRTPCKRCCK